MLGVLIALMMFFLIAASGFAQSQATGGGKTVADGSQRFVSIDFNNVDISVFIKFISELTGKNFVIDQRVRGKVTIISPSKISVDEAYKVFESVLDVHGFATVETGRLIKIIPSPDARTKNIETRFKTKGDKDDDQVVTQLIPLRFADPEEIKRLLTPMVSKSSVILSYPPTNTLIITDNYSNIARLMKILKTIDLPGVGREVTVFPIHNADAAKLVTLLETVFKTSQAPVRNRKGAAASDRNTAFVADERTNSIIMVASEDDTNRIRSLIDILDQETPKGKEKIHVYYLEYAVAEEIVAVLKDLPTDNQAKPGKAGAKEAPVVSESVKITADKATNSLIITADRDDYDTLVEIIRQIDIPRAMVYIESLIMEVNTTKSFNLGTEWQIGDTVDLNKDRQGVAGGGFTTDDSNISYAVDASGNLIPSLPSGFALGVFGEAVEIAGISFPSIAAVVQAYKKDKDVNILSTPQLLTTDNQEASITVGKNVPYQTATSTSNNDTYNSYEYRDVGKTLKITPQINKDRMVRLNLSLEVSSLADAETTDKPTTYKRTVETTVIVKDGGTVVIGGLIDDTFSHTEYKIPCLGDVPGLGWLFKTRSTGGDKTNLFIFITPRVIQNPQEAKSVFESKKNTIDELREAQIKLYRGGVSGIEPPSIETNLPSAPLPESQPDVPADAEKNFGSDTTAITPETAASSPGSESSAYLVQVHSFSDRQSANDALSRLTQLGHAATVTESKVAGKIWYRVQIGDKLTLATAQGIRDELIKQGYTGILILKNNP
jgi:general secretion pathway protein D